MKKNLNTSHVKVQQHFLQQNSCFLYDLNTSHVKVQQKGELIKYDPLKFKYISC